MPPQPINAEPQPPTTPASDWAQDSQLYVKILRDLAVMGADIAGLLHKRLHLLATEPTMNTLLAEVHGPLSDLSSPLADRFNKSFQETSAAFDAVTLSTRRSIMLAEKLAHPIAPPTKPNPAPEPIIRDGDAEIHSKPATNNHERPESQPENQAAQAAILRRESRERLDRPDPEDDPADRPISEFVEEVFREFLKRDPTLRPNASRPPVTPLKDRTEISKNAKPNTPPFVLRSGPYIPPIPFPKSVGNKKSPDG